MRDYEVTINFGFIGAEETYTVFAENEAEAERLAMEEAMDNLYVMDIVEVE